MFHGSGDTTDFKPGGARFSKTDAVSIKNGRAGVMFAPVLTQGPADDNTIFPGVKRSLNGCRQLSQKHHFPLRPFKGEGAGAVQGGPQKFRLNNSL